MKTITVNVSEPVYREFQEYARQRDRKTAELIREAMEFYRDQTIHPSTKTSLTTLRPVSVGKIRQPLASGDDLLGEMTNL